jgi:hypothetical protein
VKDCANLVSDANRPQPSTVNEASALGNFDVNQRMRLDGSMLPMRKQPIPLAAQNRNASSKPLRVANRVARFERVPPATAGGWSPSSRNQIGWGKLASPQRTRDRNSSYQGLCLSSIRHRRFGRRTILFCHDSRIAFTAHKNFVADRQVSPGLVIADLARVD